MTPLFVYTTFPDEDSAASVAEHLLKKKLVACANILPAVRSLYIWKGKVQNEGEAVMVLKTTAEQFEAMEKEIVKRHPYDIPAIVALPIETGHEPYLQWVVDQTA